MRTNEPNRHCETNIESHSVSFIYGLNNGCGAWILPLTIPGGFIRRMIKVLWILWKCNILWPLPVLKWRSTTSTKHGSSDMSGKSGTFAPWVRRRSDQMQFTASLHTTHCIWMHLIDNWLNDHGTNTQNRYAIFSEIVNSYWSSLLWRLCCMQKSFDSTLREWTQTMVSSQSNDSICSARHSMVPEIDEEEGKYCWQ